MIRVKLTMLAMAVSSLVAVVGYADGSEWVGGYNWSYWADNYVPVYGGVAVAGRNMISPAPSGTIEVPASLGGYPVAVLNHQAFAFNDSITAVMIPASVKEIGQKSFCGCANLRTVTFLGDCPKVPNVENNANADDGWVFYGTPEDLTVCVYEDARGWPSGNRWFGKKLVRRPRSPAGTETWYDETTGLTWETQSNGDGTITIRGVIGAKAPEILKIPSDCDGKSVTKVGVRGSSNEDGSFANMDITGLEIPEGVTELSEGAFHGCKNLKSVTLPSTLEVIRDNCFEDCSVLRTITLPEGLRRVEFDFLNRTAVSTLNIPSTLVEIDESALSIPSGRKFTVAVGNPRYRVENGYIYDYENKVVFMRADYDQKTFVIPDGAARIAECCFGDCGGGNITVPPSVKEIGEFAFCYCKGLTVTFLGEEPKVEDEDGGIFSGSMDVRVYVQRGRGWDAIVSRGTWQGARIAYGTQEIRYTVRFEVNGGYCAETERSVAKGKTIGVLPTPQRSGYAFKGWYLDEQLTKKATSATKVTADMILYASWLYDASAYVNVKVRDGDEGLGKVSGGNKSFRAGVKVQVKATANKGAGFVGWFEDGELVSQSASYAFEASGHDTILEAGFIPAEEDWLELRYVQSGVGYEVGQKVFPNQVWADSGSVATISVKGLPSGIKYDAKTRQFSGAFTKEGTHYITCTAKNANGYTHVLTMVWQVGGLWGDPYYSDKPPAWSKECNGIGISRELWDSLKWFQTGVPVNLKLSADGITAISGLPNGLSFDKKSYAIVGMPTKPGPYAITLQAGRRKSVRMAIVEDSGCRFLNIWAQEGGSATGRGVYSVGSTVKISAKAKNGYVFAGWYADGSEFNEVKSGDYRTASDSFVLTKELADANMSYCAEFIAKEDDRELYFDCADEWNVDTGVETDEFLFAVGSHSKPTISAKGLPAGLKLKGTKLIADVAKVKPGTKVVTLTAKNLSGAVATVEVRIVVPNLISPVVHNVCDSYIFHVGQRFEPGNSDLNCISADDGWTLSVSGLPAGFKWDARRQCFSGTQLPTKAGVYTVTFTAKRGNQRSVATATFEVLPMPEDLIGTFNGFICGNGEDVAWDALYGTCSITVGSTGKITASWKKGGETVSMSASGFDWLNENEASVLLVRNTAKYQYQLQLTFLLGEGWKTWQVSGVVSGSVYSPFAGMWSLSVRAQRNPFGKVGNRYENEEAHALAKMLSARGTMKTGVDASGQLGGPNCGLYSEMPLTFTVSENGTVKVAGKYQGRTLSGSTILHVGENRWPDMTMGSWPYAEFVMGKDLNCVRLHIEFNPETVGCRHGEIRVGVP